MSENQPITEDELWSRLGDAIGHDRIEILWELAGRARQREDYDRETTYLEQVVATATDIGEPTLVAEAHSNLGSSRFYAQDYEGSAQVYGQAADEFAALGVSDRTGAALWGQADALRMMGELDRSLDCARESRRLAESEGLDELAGEACYLQARALYNLDRDADSVEACRAGREHFRRAGMPLKVSRIDDLAISVHCYLGEYDEALELARGCLVIARETASDTDDPYARRRLAEVMQRRGDNGVALEHIDLSQQAYRSRNDLIGCASCERLRGDALVGLDRLEDAHDAFLDARILFDASGYDYDAVLCEDRRARVLQWMGEFRQAATINEHLIGALREREDSSTDMQWSAVRMLDSLHDAQCYDECVTKFEQYRPLWPDDATAEDPSYREFLGLTASAMSRVGREEQAVAMAQHVINNTSAREAGVGTAYCYEIRGRNRGADDEAAGLQDLSHAIALHLAKGRVDWARELSRDFLPVDPPTRISEVEQPQQPEPGAH